MNALDILHLARNAGALRDIDYHLPRYLLALAAVPSANVAIAIAALSRAQVDGDICLDLADAAERKVLVDNASAGPWHGIAAPSLVEWRTALLASGIVGNAADDGLPLVLDAANRLYFAKYFAFERGIAEGLLACAVDAPLAESTSIDRMLTAQFGPAGTAGADPHQRAAARVALTRQLAVITGGPGTGKTTAVTKILAAIVGLAAEAGKAMPRIRLAAPTGKAAARLGESIRAAKARMLADGIDPAQVMRIPEDASTLHRLIGTRPDTRKPRHDAANTLAIDVLVIDEASMIDVPLMARVIAALPAHARLVLLGDADQLASVEAGAVLGDICHGAADEDLSKVPIAGTTVRGSLATLVTSHRFHGDSGIGALARAINAGDADRALAVCAVDPATRLIPGEDQTALDALVARGVTAFRDCFMTHDVVEASRRFGTFRMLCALRDGPRGVAGINAAVERALAEEGLAETRNRYWRGRPLLITANDYGVQLFNGDIGLTWPDNDGHLCACFVGADGSVRRLPLNRLPAHETVFAMTVHKSQGSEFDTVAVVLPEQDAPVLTRELVYTAVTRARSAVELYGSPTLLATAINRRVRRSSGLRDALWR